MAAVCKRFGRLLENFLSLSRDSSYELTQTSSLSMQPRPYPMSMQREYYSNPANVRRLFADYLHLSSIKEIERSRSKLGAVGTICLTNFEGIYLGDPLFTPFFKFLNTRHSKQEVIFIHPQNPYLRINGTFIVANPSKSSSHESVPRTPVQEKLIHGIKHNSTEHPYLLRRILL